MINKSFNSVNILIYIISLSEYDEILYEEDVQLENAMIESLSVFESTINGEFFKETPIFLLFNKEDVLERKMKKEDKLKDLFPSYKGGQDKEKAKEFIKEVFLSKASDKSRFQILEGTVLDGSFVKNNLDKIIKVTNELKKKNQLKKNSTLNQQKRNSSVSHN